MPTKYLQPSESTDGNTWPTEAGPFRGTAAQWERAAFTEPDTASRLVEFSP